MKLIRTIALAAGCIWLLSATGCKTTESNYRSAYETARAKRDADAADMNVPQGMKLSNSATPAMTKIGTGISFPMATEFIRDDDKTVAGRDDLQRYTVVIAAFKQVFNAKALADRLKKGGIAEPLVFRNGPGMYFVGTMTTMQPAEAKAGLERVMSDSTIHCTEPFPYILRAAHLAR